MNKYTYGIEITFPHGGMQYSSFYYKLSKATAELQALVKQIEGESLEGYQLKILQLPSNLAIHEDNYEIILDWEF